jgi:HK97 family phage prohead protease
MAKKVKAEKKSKPVDEKLNKMVSKDNLELRAYPLGELRIVENKDGRPVIEGHAAMFNSLSEDLGGFQERIKPGAFKKAIKDSDIRALFNHDPNFVLGRTSNGTVTVKEDKKGLWMEVTPPDTQLIRDLVMEPIRRGDIREQSFGFIVSEDSWEGLDDEDRKTPPIRTINKVARLFDVSPVTFPAYPSTDVAVRSMNQAMKRSEAIVVPDPVIDPIKEITLNTISALEELVKVDSSDEDEAREHFKQIVMNFMAFISPDLELESYEDVLDKLQKQPAEPVVEPMQDPDPEDGEDENRTSVEPTQDGVVEDNGGEPTQPLIDPDTEKANSVTVLIRRFQDAPVIVDD